LATLKEIVMTVQEQHALWNGPAGHAWVEAQDLLDRMFAPFEHLLAQAALAAPGRRVLDIGCGTGATTLALARALGGEARVAGIDISQPMVALARDRAAQAGLDAHFLCADAQRHRFCPDSFDLLVSRFGVMFFDDPQAAFANLRAAAADGASLCCIAWRGAAENPFMTTAERAAAPLLPALPARAPDGPGQFAFADADKVERLLGAAGWRAVEIGALDVPCAFPQDQLVRYLGLLGPVGIALRQLDAATRARVIDQLLPAFAPYVDGVDGGMVRFNAACWRIEATA
jgi:SAM-dependent methyltransferase